ncbi:MAG: FKBP-type peptidyl-prolyl cis-trans isomerase N-terminal domain-containing protein, partial [Thiomicrorhabdus sp.]|nr:FKBP-type peptidyl-prolyl cis-trans isomerase N-terminal domain-containing protein [Thiomicrorhabdus sp.]
MKKILFLSLGLLASQNVIAANPLATTEQKASYTLGSDLAKNFAQQGLEIDIKAFTLGLEDALNNREPRLSEEEMMNAITEVKKSMMQKQIADRKAQGELNGKEGKAYLAENAKKPGVKTLD